MDLKERDWEIARAVENPDRVRELLSQGHKPDAVDLCEAARYGAQCAGAVETVEILLATGAINPNTRPDYADHTNTAGVVEDWASSDKSSQPPEIYGDPDEWYPLHLALTYSRLPADSQVQKANMTRMATSLLQQGADPYALFRQTIRIYNYWSRFPGEPQDDKVIDEDADLGITQLERREEREQYLLCKFHSTDSIRPLFPRKYGVCSIIHFLLQEGEFIKPVLDFLGRDLDIEHRDPQGRTLLLSACRSALGADAAIDGVHLDVFIGVNQRGIEHNPFPQPDNYYKANEIAGVTTTTSPGTPTLLEYFVNRGANVLAVDNYGKNALHHLLEARHQLRSSQTPVICASLCYVANNFGSLVNQPDKAGVYPFIAALSRIRAYWSNTEHLGTLESAIDDLLAAGADPLVSDPRGNTALHYLAQSWLDDFGARGAEQRRLCRILLDRGVDPNARNLDGQSALELYFTAFDTFLYQDRQGFSWTEWQDMDEPYAKIDEEVLEIFEKAGVNLTAQDSEGQTLLHIVARKSTLRTYDRLMLLLSKGLDPMVRNAKGETAIDVAMSLEPSGESFYATILKDHVEGLNG
jgi:ankyrin repeat protein